MIDIGVISYALSAGIYFVLALLLMTSWHGRFQGGLLISAAVASALWGVAISYDYYSQQVPEWILFVIEVFRSGAWLAFMLGLLTIHKEKKYQRLSVSLVWFGCVAITLFAAMAAFSPDVEFFIWGDDRQLLLMMLFLTLLGLVFVEQLYRNRTAEASSSIGYLCMALGAIFVYDLYCFSNAMLFSKVDEYIWGARGTLNAFAVPLIALSARHNPDLSLKVFVSRQIVFYTTSLVGSGTYLLAVAVAGYYIKFYGGEWGAIFQVIFLSGAVLVLGMVLSSPSSRAKLRIFLNKHFYSNKYEYREQWMRLTHVLTDDSDTRDFNKRVVYALTDILDANSGMLWLAQESRGYASVSELNQSHISAVEPASSEFISFLKNKKWIIELSELSENPVLYNNLKLPDWLGQLENAWLVIPLLHEGQLLGFAVIGNSAVGRTINWEDRDLLKTVSHQISSYFALIAAKEELDRAHQFDAFNRLSAFVVHDLKNLVAQLGLVVNNAAKHKNNPAFMDDTISTVENAVSKMDRLLGQLKKARFEKQQQNNVVVNKLLSEAINNLKDMAPTPEFSDCSAEMSVFADKDRFCSVIEHLIRNAQEATPDSGVIRVKLNKQTEHAVIEISDTGSGMDDEFINSRLFQPFYTTKGNAGMGIGVYEARQFVQEMGGSIDVESELDKGTTFRIQLPLGACRT